MAESSIRIIRLEEAIKILFSGATIKLKDLPEIERIFDTALQQVHDLEKSRDNWKDKYQQLNEEKKLWKKK